MESDFWEPELFRHKRENLITHLGLQDGPRHSILGHSCESALAALYASNRPKGLRKLIVSSPYASLPSWVEATAQHLGKIPHGVVRPIKKCEDRGDFENPAYEDAVTLFYIVRDTFAKLSRGPVQKSKRRWKR